MSISTHSFVPYSQSDRLIRIEEYVKSIINRNGRFPLSWREHQRREHCNRVLWELPNLLPFYEPRHEYSEHIEAFWHACEKVGLLECGQLTWVVGAMIHAGADSIAIVAEIEELIAEYAGTLPFRRRASDRRYEQQQKREGLDAYTRELMGRYYRSLVLRVDLGYLKVARVDIATV
ncbi:MAG: hypothetical protein K0Q68_1135, partial [Moraxellaceae bacterium]|nr:hypothetical protein [Moraxellaceae bacterium]